MLGFTEFIIVLMILILIFSVYQFITKNNDMVYIEAFVDRKYYLVRDKPDRLAAANLLATVKKNIYMLIDSLYAGYKSANPNSEYAKYGPYIERLKKRTVNMIITESSENSIYTSYCVNKGEEIVFCIRSKDITRALTGNIHSKNLIMYVALHEISHIACPERNHTPLFKDIFHFICSEAIKQGLYSKIDFKSRPTEYCGMTISESIV